MSALLSYNPKVFIILEDGSNTNWLGTTRSLGRMGVEVIRLSPRNWYSSKYCSTIISPQISSEPIKYLRFLIRLGEKIHKDTGCKNILLPSIDRALILLSENKKILDEFFEVIVPDWITIQKIVDKSETYTFASKLGIPTPKTYPVKNRYETNKIADTIQYPCLVKPAHSHIFTREYNLKLIPVKNRKMLLRISTDLISKGHKILIQEAIPGSDDQIYMLTTCFNKDSKPLAFFTSRKLRQHPPNFGIGSFVETIWEPKIIKLGMELLEKIRFYGIAHIEFKKDIRNGDFKLLDINGRSHTQNYLGTACGINLPYILYKDVIGEKQKPLKNYTCEFKLGIKWLHLRKDFQSFLISRKEEKIGMADWLKSILLCKKNFAILSLSDLRPFLSELRLIAGARAKYQRTINYQKNFVS